MVKYRKINDKTIVIKIKKDGSDLIDKGFNNAIDNEIMLNSLNDDTDGD